jgi:HSP20 family protein
MSNTTRWNPFREIVAMQEAMDRILEENWRGLQPTNNHLQTDIHETESAYLVLANIPGVNADQININLHDGILTISVSTPPPTGAENTRVLIQERYYGTVTRRFNLPQPVNIEGAEATYEGGVLALRLPKRTETQPRHIPVRSQDVVESES